MRPLEIHQVHEACAYGDGVTNGMLFIQRLLRQAGYTSEIYCHHVDERLVDKIRPLASYVDRQDSLILFHYSLGTVHDGWIAEQNGLRILIYHNITPKHFFAPGSHLHHMSETGRAQLRHWGRSNVFAGAIADSEFNAAELRDFGFLDVVSIGLLVDLDRIRRHSWNHALRERWATEKKVLFVGNFIEHKGHVELIRTFSILSQASTVPVRLVLVGGTVSPPCRASVEAEIAGRNLGDKVSILGKCDDDDLYALYRAADLYLSLSQHEGFGMPLVEAMAFDVPVLAADAGSVAATLNGGGLVLDQRDPITMAAAARLLLEEPGLRTAVIGAQRQAVRSYERAILVEALEAYLRRHDVDVALTQPVQKATDPRAGSWRIEGPFDSSYSLAIVNRGLAQSLAGSGEQVALVSRDGPGKFPPAPEFLARHPDLEAMWQAEEPDCDPEVALRNQYPPHVLDMRGLLRMTANYAWEESGFPAAYVREFNTTLNLITVTSRFVAKTLRDNGVHVPIRVVGNGIDHVLQFAPDSPERGHGGVFRFLHVSSCFPRKGVDALLTAWAKAFSAVDQVELLIKTFPNPHNDLAAKLDEFHAAHRDHAPIRVIDGDLDPAALHALYLNADAVVCPSRGEGFGLPLAEALALGRPVVTTAFGGHTDFCTHQSAWLCDYAFAPARTHLGVPDSVWIEPDSASLADALIACRSSPDSERRHRVDAGRTFVLTNYTWEKVAARTREAVDAILGDPARTLRLPKIGWISTWNSRCGIAAYGRALACEIEPERLAIFANRTDDRVAEDGHQVRRCWDQGWKDSLDELYGAVTAAAVDVVVVQFNFGFFRFDAFARLIERLDEAGVLVFVVLHATADVERPDLTIRLGDARVALARCCRLLVHSVHDLNRLKSIGLVDNVALFPQGMPPAFEGDPGRERRALGLAGCTIIASFGFLLPHKGLCELVEAFALLRKERADCHLLMLNALYPGPESAAEHQAIRRTIAKLGLDAHITLVTDFLDESALLGRLAAADAIVYPYQHTQESGSAAIKLGLASLAPVACTPLAIFDDGNDVVHRLPGITPHEIAVGLGDLLADAPGRAARRIRQNEWAKAHAWTQLSRRLDGLLRGEVADLLTPGWRLSPPETAARPRG